MADEQNTEGRPQDGPSGGPSASSTPPQPGPPPPGPPPPGPPPPPHDPAAGTLPGSTPPPGSRPVNATVRLFKRSSDDKIIAGVCGGLGRATNVDPVVYRVLAVVLTFFGGAGLLLYALGWLLLPEDRTDVSLTERALGRNRGQGRTSAVALAVILVIAAALAVSGVMNNWAATVLVVLVGGAIFLLLRRDGHPAPAGVPAAPTSAVAYTPTGYEAAAGSGPSGGTTAWYSTPSSPPGAAGYADPAGPGGPGVPEAPSYGSFATPPTPPKAPKTPGVLGPLTLSVLLISLGVLAAFDVSGAQVAAAAYPALALLVIGLGLLMGTWFGRSRWLIALGVLAALALPPTIAADVFHPSEWESRTQRVAVTDVGAIRDSYDFRPGRAELDMTDVNFAERTIRTRVDMPAGTLGVLVPDNVDVVTDLDLGAGDAVVFSHHSSGLGISDRVEDLGADGRGGGVLELRIDQGLGDVEVRRGGAT